MDKDRVSVEPETFLTDEALSQECVARVTEAWSTDRRLGAVVSFAGVVRGDMVDGSPVAAIEFSAHREMAEESVRRLVERLVADTRSDTVRIYLRHALGRVPRGGIPIVIIVGTSHRKEAFSLCSGILELFKQEVPIYGKELTDSGGHSWKENR
ncbi:MAG: molybdenum cofactor biosynthesis protein MoaE [Spirochaetota bacterium]